MNLLQEEKCGWHIKSHHYETQYCYHCSWHTRQSTPLFIIRLAFFKTGAFQIDGVLALFILTTVSELKVLLVTKKKKSIICSVTTMTVTKQTFLESTPASREKPGGVWVPIPTSTKIDYYSFRERIMIWHTSSNSHFFWGEKWTSQDFKSCAC